MENLYYTALYKVAKRLDFLLDFCIEKNREKNLVVWPKLKVNFSNYESQYQVALFMMLLAYNVQRHVFSSCLVSQVQGSCISRAAPENLNLSLAHKQVNVKFNSHV